MEHFLISMYLKQSAVACFSTYSTNISNVHQVPIVVDASPVFVAQKQILS
jgi:hypothetical protein